MLMALMCALFSPKVLGIECGFPHQTKCKVQQRFRIKPALHAISVHWRLSCWKPRGHFISFRPSGQTSHSGWKADRHVAAQNCLTGTFCLLAVAYGGGFTSHAGKWGKDLPALKNKKKGDQLAMYQFHSFVQDKSMVALRMGYGWMRSTVKFCPPQLQKQQDVSRCC